MLSLLLGLSEGPPQLPPLPEWAAIAPVPYRAPPVVTPMMVQFVADEVKAGRCATAKPDGGHYHVEVDVAVLLAPDLSVRAAVPHAIDCPTVEQYGAGLATSFARDNVLARAGRTDQWYRATIIFDWTE